MTGRTIAGLLGTAAVLGIGASLGSSCGGHATFTVAARDLPSGQPLSGFQAAHLRGDHALEENVSVMGNAWTVPGGRPGDAVWIGKSGYELGSAVLGEGPTTTVNLWRASEFAEVRVQVDGPGTPALDLVVRHALRLRPTDFNAQVFFDDRFEGTGTPVKVWLPKRLTHLLSVEGPSPEGFAVIPPVVLLAPTENVTLLVEPLREVRISGRGRLAGLVMFDALGVRTLEAGRVDAYRKRWGDGYVHIPPDNSGSVVLRDVPRVPLQLLIQQSGLWSAVVVGRTDKAVSLPRTTGAMALLRPSIGGAAAPVGTVLMPGLLPEGGVNACLSNEKTYRGLLQRVRDDAPEDSTRWAETTSMTAWHPEHGIAFLSVRNGQISGDWEKGGVKFTFDAETEIVGKVSVRSLWVGSGLVRGMEVPDFVERVAQGRGSVSIAGIPLGRAAVQYELSLGLHGRAQTITGDLDCEFSAHATELQFELEGGVLRRVIRR